MAATDTARSEDTKDEVVHQVAVALLKIGAMEDRLFRLDAADIH